MTIYITQGRYTDQAITGFVAKPEDRADAVRKLMTAAGGKMIAYYVTLGDYDFMVISEGRNLTNCAHGGGCRWRRHRSEDHRRDDLGGCEESHGQGQKSRSRVSFRRQLRRRIRSTDLR